MANFKQGQCLLWQSGLPREEGIGCVSPGFIYQGSEWYFEFCPVNNYDFEMHLRMKLEWGGFRPFHIYCHGESGELVSESPYKFLVHKIIKPDEPPAVLFNSENCAMCNAGEYLKGKVSFMFIFRRGEEFSNLKVGTSTAGEVLTHADLNLDIETFELESFSRDFGNLLDHEELSDVQLKCGDCVIPAHRSVLAARSEVFSAMFRNKMKESSSGIVDITDVEAPVLKSFLKYVYSGNAPDLSEDMVTKLYAVGDKYAVNSLKKKCRESMIRNLSGENYLNFLMIADVHNDKDFKNAVIDFVQDQPEFLKLDSWYRFSKEHSKLAFEVYRRIFNNLNLSKASQN